MPTPMDSPSFATLLDERFREIEVLALADTKDWITDLFTVVPSDRATERFGMIGELGDWVDFTGTVSYDALYEQYNVVATHRQYGQGMIITRAMVDDDLTGLMRGDLFEPFINAAIVTRQKEGARIFNFMTSNDLRFYNHTEAVALVSNSHTTRTPGVSTTTGFDNLVTDALTPTSYRAARILFRRLRNDRGNLIDMEADELWCGLDLGPVAEEIVGTRQGLNTDFGNKNPEFNSAKVMSWNRISDTNDWAICNAKARKKNLRWYDHTKPEYRQITDFESMQIKRAGYMRFSFARRHHAWIVGASVS